MRSSSTFWISQIQNSEKIRQQRRLRGMIVSFYTCQWTIDKRKCISYRRGLTGVAYPLRKAMREPKRWDKQKSGSHVFSYVYTSTWHTLLSMGTYQQNTTSLWFISAIKTFIMQQSKRIQDFWKIFCRYRNACQNIRYPKFWFLLTLFGRYKEKKQSRIISANSSRSKILAHHVSDWFTCQPIGGMIFNI